MRERSRCGPDPATVTPGLEPALCGLGAQVGDAICLPSVPGVHALGSRKVLIRRWSRRRVSEALFNGLPSRLRLPRLRPARNLLSPGTRSFLAAAGRRRSDTIG